MPASTYLANALLAHQTGKTAFSMPTVYVAVSSTTPTIGGTGVTEPTGGSYARVATPSSTWATPASGSIANSAEIAFPVSTADWASAGNLTHGVLFDAPTGGNMLSFGAFPVAKNVLNGDQLKIAVGGLTIALS